MAQRRPASHPGPRAPSDRRGRAARSCISRGRGRPLNRRAAFRSPRDQRMTNWHWQQGTGSRAPKSRTDLRLARRRRVVGLYDRDAPPVRPPTRIYGLSRRHPAARGVKDEDLPRAAYSAVLSICPDVLRSSLGSVRLSSLQRFMSARGELHLRWTDGNDLLRNYDA